MKKILTMMLTIFVTWGGLAVLTPTDTFAACADTFMGFRPWYYGLTDSDCNIITPSESGGTGISIETCIWTIVLNIVSILSGIVGYLAIGFLIYGGYLYIMARGDASRISKGKNTIIRAIIGLVICIMATVISGLIVNIITSAVGA